MKILGKMYQQHVHRCTTDLHTAQFAYSVIWAPVTHRPCYNKSPHTKMDCYVYRRFANVQANGHIPTTSRTVYKCMCIWHDHDHTRLILQAKMSLCLSTQQLDCSTCTCMSLRIHSLHDLEQDLKELLFIWRIGINNSLNYGAWLKNNP